VTERDIAQAIQAGSRLGFEGSMVPLVLDARAELYRLLREKFQKQLAFGTSKESGEDLLQELYMRVTRAIENDQIEDPDALVAYARGMAANLRTRAIQKQTARMRKVVRIDSYRKRDSDTLRSLGNDPEQDAIAREEASELAGIFHALLADLDPIDRTMVDRFYFRGHDPVTIQADLGLGPGQFRGRMYAIRQKLKSDYERVKRLSPPKSPSNSPPLKEPA
jgi:RNA polymerase sigma factor (sigma-70 family)